MRVLKFMPEVAKKSKDFRLPVFLLAIAAESSTWKSSLIKTAGAVPIARIQQKLSILQKRFVSSVMFRSAAYRSF